MASLRIEQLVKSYGATRVLHGVDLKVADGEFVVLVGPSGCGKSTLLRMIAGLDDISSGQMWIGERLANGVPPQGRNISMVFQSYALFPHMDVRGNVGFGPRIRRDARETIAAKVAKAARTLNLSDYLDRSRASSRAASGSASRWAAPSCASPTSSCSTSRCPISTPSCACRCAPRSRRCIRR